MVNTRTDVIYFLPPDPIRNQGYLDTLHHTKPDNDPEAPPPKKPGEAVVIRTAIIGLLAGGLVGFFLGSIFITGITVLCTLAGIIIGCLTGVFLGEALKKRHLSPRL